LKNRIFLTLLTVLLTANAGYCLPLHVKNTIIKFSFAMGGVVLSSLLIFVGLTVYNKFRGMTGDLTPEEEVLKTPKTKESAIQFFIRKNRLR
jgi:hypothetical protein